MPRTIIAANWKMHLNVHEASLLTHRLSEKIPAHRDVEVVLAPSFVCLQPLALEVDHRKFKLAAQNGYFKDEGAFTGEVSFTMLRHLVDYAIVGHSERRIYFNETLETVRDKIKAAVSNGITPILCIGENKPERSNGETKIVLHDQLTTALSNLTANEVEDIVIAYEPVWAISTFGGERSKPDEMQGALAFIRHNISELYGTKTAERVSLLYGGSVDASTAGGYLRLPDCNGALVGGASLNAEQFAGIVNEAYRLNHLT